MWASGFCMLIEIQMTKINQPNGPEDISPKTSQITTSQRSRNHAYASKRFSFVIAELGKNS
jgi:hypothetical protein